MNFLMQTTAYNQHIQNIALALYEAGLLGALYTGFADNYRHALSKRARHFVKRRLSVLDAALSRRRIHTLPDELIYKFWMWEALRILAGRFRMGPLVQDWLWERREHDLDKNCARVIRKNLFDGVFGLEYGTLFSIRAARELGKKSVIAFLSPHHAFREKWVDVEYEKFPELLTPSKKRLQKLAKVRDNRRDEEASLADFIYVNSQLTAQSFLTAGFSQRKIIPAYLGGPPPVRDDSLTASPTDPLRFIYAGSVAVHKGVHYLLQAWDRLSPGRAAELHLYGGAMLPKKFLERHTDKVILHGSVPQKELFTAYRHSSVLVFPTLCDGFGAVILEAMANALPVITTKNAGASELVREGENGFVVDAGSEDALAEKIEWCIRNRGILHEMRRNALQIAQVRTWDNFRTLLIEQFRQKGLT